MKTLLPVFFLFAIAVTGNAQFLKYHNNPDSIGFRGHWAGIGVGFNNYVNKKLSTHLTGDDQFLDLKAARSLNVNINIVQFSFAIRGDYMGVYTGAGIDFYNYFFSGNNNIMDTLGKIVIKKYINPTFNTEYTLQKSKLTVVCITVPIIFEYQFPKKAARNKRFRVAGGVLASFTVNSYSKVVYTPYSAVFTEFNDDSFYLHQFRGGVTVRGGYKFVNVYANFYPTPLFDTSKAPTVYPVDAGLSIVIPWYKTRY
jgi:hypothetical protein